MSTTQEQPREADSVKYGDVFKVSGEIASKAVTPQDAATLQAAENAVLGHTPKGGTAATLQSAADINERRGLVGHDDMTDDVRDRGATIVVSEVAGYRTVTEAIGGQVIGQYGEPTDDGERTDHKGSLELGPNKSADTITIGEALEAADLSAGDKPVETSDVAAIQAAEVRATGLGHVVPGGIAAEAQSAEAHNRRVRHEKDMIKLGDILADASDKLLSDKPVTREDVEAVISAEIRNSPNLTTTPGGVSASLAAAARLNQQNK